MFKKLLKHEFNAQRGLFTLLGLSALGAGVLGCAAIQLIIHIVRNYLENPSVILSDGQELFMIVAMMALFFLSMVLAFAIGACSVAVWVMLVYRFYKHHFTDEGYLTFTLPATTHQILLSSIVNILIWTVIIALVIIASYSVMLAPVFAMAMQEENVNIFAEMQSAMTDVYGGSIIVVQIFAIVCTMLGNLILPLLAATIGAQVAKKHKLLAGIGIYYGINAGISFITGILSLVITVADAAIMYNGGTMFLTFLIPGILYLGIAIGGYFLMHYMVSRKLNLP